ncbi:hypothetical protein ACS0TY_033420 [Phlomoides rotata]
MQFPFQQLNHIAHLSGNAPMVIARGGFSGIFPSSSYNAYELAVMTGSPDLHVWCDVQLTKDGVGICFPDIRLNNASNIDQVYKNKRNTYTVNGVPVEAWFSVDFTSTELASVGLTQSTFTRTDKFDGNPTIFRLEDLPILIKPPGFWLNIPHDAFFSQHNLSMRSYIISLSRRMVINYISSPEVGFLKGIVSQFRTRPTKLIFQFLGRDVVEPSTNQTYISLMKNLTFIKTFATGILVPKDYIWLLDNSLYLQSYTSLVLDAHKEGLEVFAYTFANDAFLPYNYSYDPVAECLSFIDNGLFSIDGMVSDFPVTPSATIDCFSHMGENDTVQEKTLIISSEGASGDYPGCTDKAYAKAVSDGVDILDCPVQITSDGIPFCLGSINLRNRTNAVELNFSSLTATNKELNITDGIFAYSLTWSQIQTLKPVMFSPYSSEYSLLRNPRVSRDGNFVKLSDFLAFANNASSVSGVLISIENAAYLAEKQGLGVTDAVLDALSKVGYDNQTSKKIMIKSSDSAVLSKFKSNNSDYELVYAVDEDVRDILNSTILEIKKFSHTVVISKKSVYPVNVQFLTGDTTIVPKLQAFNLSVYVQLFRNEFISQPWDFYSDPYVEINAHVNYIGVDGILTDYPATAAKFRRNRCLGYKDPPPYFAAPKAGDLVSLVAYLPPAEPPNPVLTKEDVDEPPLPPVSERHAGTNLTAPGPIQRNDQPTLVASTILIGIISMLVAALLCWV